MYMTLLEAVIMGIVQGITEFLPVSSSGHLALFHNILDNPVDNLLFDIALHVGTLIPVFIVLRTEILAILRRPFQKLTGLLIVGTVPAVAAALLFKDNVEALFSDVRFLMVGFAVTGLLLLYADCVKKSHLTKGLSDITYTDAFVIGCVQAVAIAPSVSRSGSTTAAALFRKVNRKEAAAFVFLLSIPAILGAAVLEAKDLLTGAITVTPSDGLNLVFGFTASALAGYLSMVLVFKLIQKARLRYFSFYLFALAAFICVDTFALKGFVFGG
jgi:undecaprenyl-diphosphatase